jgi:hypothetical protein
VREDERREGGRERREGSWTFSCCSYRLEGLGSECEAALGAPYTPSASPFLLTLLPPPPSFLIMSRSILVLFSLYVAVQVLTMLYVVSAVLYALYKAITTPSTAQNGDRISGRAFKSSLEAVSDRR